jgi:hypothetical protein
MSTPPQPSHDAPQPHAGYAVPGGYPVATPPPAGSSAARNALGRISLILGIVLIGWMFVHMILQAQAISSGDSAAIGITGLITAILNVIVALAAIGFGIAGIAARAGSKVSAGIGTGIGAMALAGAATSLLYPVLIQLFGAF